jgi:hypothetical protein
MKKLFVLTIAAVSLSLFTVGCGDKNKEEDNDIIPPIISFSSDDTLILDLGDKTAALSGVTAKDDVDGNITRSIKLLTETELETIGPAILKYSVSDAANNQVTAERPAIIRSGKLAGKYEVSILPEGAIRPMNDFIITVSERGIVELSIENFHNGANDRWIPVTVFPDGPGKLRIYEEGSFLYDRIIYLEIKGEMLYEKVNGTYVIKSLKYILNNGNDPVIEYTSLKCELIP